MIKNSTSLIGLLSFQFQTLAAHPPLHPLPGKPSQTSRLPGRRPRDLVQESGGSWGPVTVGVSAWLEGTLGSPSPLVLATTRRHLACSSAPLRTLLPPPGTGRAEKEPYPRRQTSLWPVRRALRRIPVEVSRRRGG